MTSPPHVTTARQAAARSPVDFERINRAALAVLPALLQRWLPGGRVVGREWTCGSLRGEAGDSCRVNLGTGRWADFATGERGGDVVALAAAVHRLTQLEAARRMASMLGLEEHRHG